MSVACLVERSCKLVNVFSQNLWRIQSVSMREEDAKEELTFIMRTIGCKKNQHINRAQLSQAIESISAEDFNPQRNDYGRKS